MPAILAPWILAGCLALAAAQAARLYLAARAEAVAERQRASLADLELRSMRNQLEAERILSRREIADLKDELERQTIRIREFGLNPKGGRDEPPNP
jgi:hypothetical protein